MRSRRKRKESKSRAISIISLVFLLAVLWVWKSVEAHKLSREYSDLEKIKNTMIEDNKRLGAKLESLRSIAWIDSCARRFNMTHRIKVSMVFYDRPIEKPRPNPNLLVNIGDYIIKTAKAVLK